MPYNEFTEIRDINSKLLKLTYNKLTSNFSNLADFIDKTTSCPKCGHGETFLNSNDKYECAICSYNWK